MNARVVFLLLLAAAAPLASGQLSTEFYRTTCPDAEKIIFGIVEKRFKEDPGTAAGLLRLVFHDCFANGCDASILIDPLSNQASEKEAGPNISVKGYDVIDDIKTELEKKCPNVVSCADIVAVSARDAVRLTGGPAYRVPTGRRDSTVSNREDADNLPGPDIAVPKLISDFSAKGFDIEEMIALVAGGHTIGTCKCFFIETDAAPIELEYKKNISLACDGANRDRGSVPLDQITPNIFDGNYFALSLAKKMPLTVDRLMGLDSKTEPVLKAMAARPESFVPLFAKAMEKVSVLQVLTGKDGEIRRSCGEFNNPQPTNDAPSVIRVSSLQPDQMGLSEPAGARKVRRGRADSRKVNGGEPVVNAPTTPAAEVVGAVATEPPSNKVTGPIVADSRKVNGGEPVVNAPTTPAAVATEPPSNKVTGPIIVAPGNKVLGDEPGSKLPGGVVGVEAAAKTLNDAKIGNVPGAAAEEAAAKAARDEEFMKRNLEKLRRHQEAANNKAPGVVEAAKVVAHEVANKMNPPKLRVGQQ